MRFSPRPALLLPLLAVLAALLPPPAARAAEPCTPAAALFGKTLCREELGLRDIAGDPDTPDNRQIALQNRQALHDALWRRALLEKFDAAAIVPLESDVDDFRARVRASMRARHEADRQTAAYLDKVLAARTFRPEDERQLRAIARAASLSVRFYEDQERRKAELPPEYGFIGDETERQLALTMLGGWKADRALLQAYGGRLVRTADGLAPIDARRAFIRYMRRDGGLRIHDPALQDLFAEPSGRAPDPGPDEELVPPGSALYQAFLASPAWRFPAEDPAERLDALRRRVESLPAAQSP